MVKKMDFSKLRLEQLAEEERTKLEQKRRWKSREANPVVQMSIRMGEEEYLEFRGFCKAERRTNGEMLEEMMRFYKANNL